MGNEQAVKPDIAGKEEIRTLVDAFYERIRKDDLLGPVFNDKVEDWSKHLPTMYSFWESILYGKSEYSGNPFAKHLNLPVGKEHFVRWLKLFELTVDELFEGEKANQAKQASKSIAHSFQVRMGLDPFYGIARNEVGE